MVPIHEVMTDAFRAALLDIAEAAWDFARDEPRVRMSRDMETAIRFAVRSEREPDIRAVAQGQ